MIQLHAQPYDISATGFYFSKASEYAMSAMNNRNDNGDIVEEYEIQFIDGEDIDCALAAAWGLNQSNFGAFLEVAEEWEEDDKIGYIIAVGECGYSHDQVADDQRQINLRFYELSSLKELAEQFVDEGLYGEIPETIQFYIDYEAIARDLSVDYSEVTIAGAQFIFHCA